MKFHDYRRAKFSVIQLDLKIFPRKVIARHAIHRDARYFDRVGRIKVGQNIERDALGLFIGAEE